MHMVKTETLLPSIIEIYSFQKLPETLHSNFTPLCLVHNRSFAPLNVLSSVVMVVYHRKIYSMRYLIIYTIACILQPVVR